MYEFTLSCDKIHSNFADYAQRCWEEGIKQAGGAIARIDNDRNCNVAIACDKPYIKQIKSLVMDTVTEILAVGYKNIYLRKALCITKDNFVINTLINTMCAFDNSFDKECIRAVVNIEDRVNLEGYYNFRMGKVKGKWKEVAEITSRNDLLFSGSAFAEEFLSYLVETVPIGINNLSVVLDKNDFSLFDSNNKLIVPASTLYSRSTVEEEAMLNIICLRPKRIRLYCDRSGVNGDFVRLVESLFEVKEVKNS